MRPVTAQRLVLSDMAQRLQGRNAQGWNGSTASHAAKFCRSWNHTMQKFRHHTNQLAAAGAHGCEFCAAISFDVCIHLKLLGVYVVDVCKYSGFIDYVNTLPD